jgi:ribosomal silencing factor RsfS
MLIHNIFLSYSRSDGYDFAKKLADGLQNEGFDVWIDKDDIRAGSAWYIEIEKALENCDCLLFIETENSVRSEHVLDEVYYALEQKKKIIPLLVVESKTPYRLKKFQHVDFTSDYEAGLAHLIRELRNEVADHLVTEEKLNSKKGKTEHKKDNWILMAVFAVVLIIAFAIIYNRRVDIPENESTPLTNNQSAGDSAVTPLTTTDTNSVVKKSANQLREKKVINNKVSPASTLKEEKSGISNEAVEGDWRIVGVEPSQKSFSGYLKIEKDGERNITIKNYIQFYYKKMNDTLFLTVLNAFAGCNSCELNNEIKLKVEDIAVGSQYYQTVKMEASKEQTRC